ncbi:MAG: ParB/RepB/Spo0J family partition protein [Lachnospiraceae bacterium]|nr:ParB/RepB/Spo0J family partition protein [Lachnospiraceae bacterium]
MKSSAKDIKLASVDDLFKTDESRADDERERVQEIAVSDLHPFKDHPFKVLDDEKMMETVESVQQYGVLVPIIARPSLEGGYEIVSGHRRHRACELAGKETMPVIVRELDDDEAVLLMVDSNLQRESILPSERAFALKMKLEAMKHQGARSDLTSAQVGRKLDGRESREILAEQVGQSRNQVSRYIHLTELIPPLLEMVDEKKIAFNPAYELSFLKPEEQQMLIDTMEYEQATPSLSQAQRLKQFSQDGRLTEDSMLAIMSEEKKPVQDRVMFTSDVLRQYFPKDYTPKRMEETIIKLLEQWKQRRQQQQQQQQKHHNLR